MDSTWYKIDNSAKLFPAVADKINSSVYRLSVVLKDEVNPQYLQKAVDELYKYYPMYMVRVKKGLFWNYLEPLPKPIQIEREEQYPCAPFDIKDKQNAMRIIYAKHRISVEVFHILTDGSGALEFMKTLLYSYMKNYKEVSSEFIRLKDVLNETDYEDSYLTHSTKTKIQKRNLPLALHIQGKPFENYGNQVIHGNMSSQKVLEVSRSYGVTITSYLAAALVKAIIDNTDNPQNKAVIVSVPINLRKSFESETLSNFFGVANIVAQVNKGMSFDEILEICVNELKEELQIESMQEIINANVAYESVPGTKFVPLFIKNKVIDVAHSYISERSKTLTISNLGVIRLPESMIEEIENFELVLYPTETAPMNATAISFNDILTITFVSRISDNTVIAAFYKQLADHGIDVSVYSNEWGGIMMHRCPNCNVNVYNNHSHCPLCKEYLGQRSETTREYIQYKVKNTKQKIYQRKAVRIFLAFVPLLLIGINIMTYTLFPYLWSTIVIFGTLYSTLSMTNTLNSKRPLGYRIILNYLLLFVWILVIELSLGFQAYSIEYILPISSVLVSIVCFVDFIKKQNLYNDLSIYILIMIILDLIPSVLIVFRQTLVKWPSYTALGVSIVMLLFMLIYNRGKLKNEIKKRVHS